MSRNNALLAAAFAALALAGGCADKPTSGGGNGSVVVNGGDVPVGEGFPVLLWSNKGQMRLEESQPHEERLARPRKLLQA